jgi:hypothetical protein
MYDKILYVLEEVDKCTDRSEGLQCGSPKNNHPLRRSGFTHEFKGGMKEYRPATLEEVAHGQNEFRKIIEHETLAKYHQEWGDSYDRAFEDGGKSNDATAAHWHYRESQKHAALAHNLKQGQDSPPKT